MGYRDMLKRYIRRVNDTEGTAFLPTRAFPDRTNGGARTVSFTAEEIAELEALEAEGIADEKREAAGLATAAMSGWMPIATAPKNRLNIVVANAETASRARWEGESWYGWIDDLYGPPTHWMPLPPALDE